MNVSALAGLVAYCRPGRFEVYPRYSLRCPQENETCRRRCARTAHTKERILELPEAAVLETGFGATVIGVATGWLSQPQLTNRADCQRDTGGGFAAGCLDTMATAGFLDTVEEDVRVLPHKNQRTDNDNSWVVSLPTDCTPVGPRQLSPQK